MIDSSIEYRVSITTDRSECPTIDLNSELKELSSYSELSKPGKIVKKTNEEGGWSLVLCATHNMGSFYKAIDCITTWLGDNPNVFGHDHGCSLTVGVFTAPDTFSSKIVLEGSNIKNLAAANMKYITVFYPPMPESV